MIHGAILLLSACILPRILNLIPLASLAAILLMVGYKLSRLSLYRNMFRLGYEQFIPFAGTIIGILLTDLLKGIVMGIAIAIFFILRKNYKHSYHFRKEKSPEAETVTLRLSEEVTFLNKASIRERLDSMPSATRVIIDGSHSVHIDHDVLEIIHNFRANTAPQRNIQVETIGIVYSP
jgi:carbonic anhydrase